MDQVEGPEVSARPPGVMHEVAVPAPIRLIGSDQGLFDACGQPFLAPPGAGSAAAGSTRATAPFCPRAALVAGTVVQQPETVLGVATM